MEEYEIINQTIDKLSDKTAVVIEHYANWYIYDATMGMVLGAVLITVAIYAAKKSLLKKDDWDSGNVLLACGVSALIGFFGLVAVLCNVSNLFEPEAAAYQRLITDITGGNT